MAERLLDQHGQCLVVEHVASAVDEAVLTVDGVGIERHVGDDAELREFLLQRPHHARHEAFGVVRLFGELGLERLVDHREQGQCRHAELHRTLGRLQQQVEALALDAGHGTDFLDALLAIEHEHRVDEIIGGQRVLAHQAAGEVVAAHAAHAGAREVASGRTGSAHQNLETKSITNQSTTGGAQGFAALAGTFFGIAGSQPQMVRRLPLHLPERVP